MSIPLVKTKLIVPPKRPNHIPRPRLLSELDGALQQRQHLILVSAKAGSGKTTLVSTWVHKQEHPASWLALDVNDNDPRRFCNYLLASLQRLGLEISTLLSDQLQAEQLSQADTLMTALVNELASQTAPCMLVFDDYHLITNEWIHRAVGFFIEHQPPEITLILVTRVDPPLPLARLRGRGLVREIRDEDLRFTLEESLQFMTNSMELDLSTEIVSILETQTEGWIVGLQMAAISMHGRTQVSEVSAFINAFSGTNRYILDYLMEEVLGQQSPAVQNFLLETSILPRMCSPLCDAVQSNRSFTTIDQDAAKAGEYSRSSATKVLEEWAEMADSQTILTHLERTNLFVVPLDNDRHWYRYHHLFADLLQNTLQENRSAAEIRELHRRASLWHERENQLEEAMVHAMAADDYEHAAEMIDENIVSMLSRSEAPVLLNWIEKLPAHIAASRPWVDVYRAYTLALSGRSQDAEHVIDEVEKRLQPDTPRSSELLGEIAAIRAFTANMQGDTARVLEMASLAEEKLPDEHYNARGMTAYALADTYFAKDDMDRASQASLEMLDIGEKLGRLLMSVTALCDLATTRKAQGQLYQAQELYNKAYTLMADRNGLDSRVRCPYEVGMADLLFEWNRLDEAFEHAQTGVAYGQRFNVPSLQTSGHLTLMRIYQVKGELDSALNTLHAAERFVKTHPLQLATSIAFNTSRVTFWLAAGDLQSASRWAEECSSGSELEQITKARLLLAKGDVGSAQQLLAHQWALAEAGKRTGRLLAILCLQTLAYKAGGDLDQAKAALVQALTLARPEGYMRLFLDMGSSLIELLQPFTKKNGPNNNSLQGTRIFEPYAQDILDAFLKDQKELQNPVAIEPNIPPPAGSPLASPLTEREIVVLTLLADGISNKEMANRLVVAPSTIKQHLKNIYNKLDVHSRIQAVKRGQELGLI